jgi:hypothetical protein
MSNNNISSISAKMIEQMYLFENHAANKKRILFCKTINYSGHPTLKKITIKSTNNNVSQLKSSLG